MVSEKVVFNDLEFFNLFLKLYFKNLLILNPGKKLTCLKVLPVGEKNKYLRDCSFEKSLIHYSK